MSKFRNFEKYEVYEDGRIWSYKSNKWLKPKTEKNGYQRVCLSDNECKMKWYYLHRVVYEAVTGESIPEGMQCNHINEDKTDNRFCNINLLTPKENLNYGTRNARAAKSLSKALKGIIPKANPPKQVGAFKNGELIFTFPSSNEAGRNGFDKSAVSRCCNGKLPHYKGYEWRYI